MGYIANVPDLNCSTSGQNSSLLKSLNLKLQIKSLNLNFAGLLKYFAAHHGRPNLKAKSFTIPFAARTVLWAGAGAAGEQTADHGCGETGEADQPQLNPLASRQRPRPGAQALTRVLPSSSE